MILFSKNQNQSHLEVGMSGNWKGDLHVAKCEDEILTAVMMYGLPGTRFWEISRRKKAKLILKPSEAEIASKRVLQRKKVAKLLRNIRCSLPWPL